MSEFSGPQMKSKAIAAAEQYYQSNSRPAQPGASTTPAGSQASIPNFHLSTSFGYAAAGRRGRLNEGDQRSRWHSQPDVCFYWFRSRWAYWFRSRWESFPNGLVLGSHGGDTGNSTAMSDGKAKSEVEESLLRWRLHGVEGFDLTG